MTDQCVQLIQGLVLSIILQNKRKNFEYFEKTYNLQNIQKKKSILTCDDDNY